MYYDAYMTLTEQDLKSFINGEVEGPLKSSRHHKYVFYKTHKPELNTFHLTMYDFDGTDTNNVSSLLSNMGITMTDYESVQSIFFNASMVEIININSTLRKLFGLFDYRPSVSIYKKNNKVIMGWDEPTPFYLRIEKNECTK